MRLLSLYILVCSLLRVLGFARLNQVTTTSTSCGAIKYGGVQHAGILVSDASKSKEFYMGVFGCTDDTHLRPTTLEYPGGSSHFLYHHNFIKSEILLAGAFMRFGNDQIHLMQLPSMDPKEGRPEHGGKITST